MAKRLLLNALVKFLGEFIELDENNLSLGVWSGQIVLSNLKLKTDNILKKFNFTIFRGSVKSLEILVPWTSLLTSPLKIKLDGILLDVGPMEASYRHNKSEASNTDGNNEIEKERLKEEMIVKLIAERFSKLKMYDEYLELTYSLLVNGENDGLKLGDSSNGSGKDEGYIQQWTARIIDNIELSLSNIHIRYEDSITIPNHCFACGITLESFIISTCDDNWQPAYVSKPNASSVNKLASMVNLGIYWDIESDHLADLSFDKWSKIMTSMIYVKGKDLIPPTASSSSTAPSLLQSSTLLLTPSSAAKSKSSKDHRPDHYLVLPNNSLFVKLTHNKILSPSNNNVRFDVTAECSDIKLHLDAIQYQQMMLLSYYLSSTSQVKIPHLYRPSLRPLGKVNCRLWWKYALFLLRIKPKYINLIKLCRKAKDEGIDPAILLTRKESEELVDLQKRLALDVLKKFHQLAYTEMVEDRRKSGLPFLTSSGKANDSQKSSKSDGSGWFGGWFSASADNLTLPDSSVHTDGSSSSSLINTTGDIAIEGLLNEFDRQESLQTKQLFQGFNVKLFSSSDLLISSSWKPMVELRTALFLGIEKHDSYFGIDCQLTDLSVKEALDISPFHPHIISVKSDQLYQNVDHSRKPTISISVKAEKGKTKIFATALPIEIYINKTFIQAFLAEFKAPPEPPRYCHQRSRRKTLSEGTPELLQVPTSSNHTRDEENGEEEIPLSFSGDPDSANVSFKTQLRKSETVQQIIKNAKSGIEIEFQAHAPKIILPEDCRKDKGFLLLDSGYLAFKGSLYDTGFSCNLSLTSINAGLPVFIHDLYSTSNSTLYLIKVIRFLSSYSFILVFSFFVF
jgi:hypothetical protein